MPRFPNKEAEIQSLSMNLALGLWNNQPIFPEPPISGIDFIDLINAYKSAKEAHIAAQAAAEQKIADKDDALEELTDALKSNIRYAENTVNYDDEKLKLIGWSGKSAPNELQPPGETRQLEAPKQGDGWLFLDWKAPADGGKVSAYKIQRRNRPDGAWQDVATAIETETTLVQQPTMAELEYRIIALNKAGEGSPSNTVMAVL
jgi:hypothetical protein